MCDFRGEPERLVATYGAVMEGAIDGHLHLRFFFIFPKLAHRFV